MKTKYICKDHAEWLEVRNGYIGGSDAGAVIGINPYKSALGLWADKLNKVEAFSGNIATRCGTLLEPLVAQLFCEVTGKKVRNDNATMFNDKYPYSCANIDRKIVGESAFLECKTTTNISIIKTLNNGSEFPLAYYAQCLHYLAVTEFKKCYLAVLVENRELKVYEMERDEEMIAALMDAERDFWERYVLTDTQPPADASANSSETLAKLFPVNDPEKEVDLAEMVDVFDMLITAKAQKATADGAIKQAENTIKQAMADATKGYCCDKVVTWRTDKNGSRRFIVK